MPAFAGMTSTFVERHRTVNAKGPIRLASSIAVPCCEH
jgi:hypothetical protein